MTGAGFSTKVQWMLHGYLTGSPRLRVRDQAIGRPVAAPDYQGEALTLGHVAAVTGSSLLSCWGCGSATLQEIRHVLWRYGLALADDDGSDPHARQKRLAAMDRPEYERSEQQLAYDLVCQWDSAKAAVLADWCEERGLTGVSEELRRGPSAACRASVGALAACLGVHVLPVLKYWRAGWFRDKEGG